MFTVSIFFVTAVWIASNLYHAWATSTISADLQLQILPIDPTFDTATIDSLKNRSHVEPLTAAEQPLISPTPTLVLITPSVGKLPAQFPISIQGQ